MKILIVEDNELQRKLLEEQFKQVGFTTLAVEDGKQALEALSAIGATDFDLIISDVNMPGIGGFELAKLVKRDKKKWNVPFLLYSSGSTHSEDDIELARRYGVDKYVLQSGIYGIVKEVIEYLK